MNKKVTTIQILFMVLSIMTWTFFITNTVYALESQPSGSGSNDDPYIISSKADLIWLSTQVNNGDKFSGKFFKQQNDIYITDDDTLKGTPIEWTPIGSSDNCPFSGNYDGDSHYVSNLKINSDNKVYMGFFGVCSNAEIKNIRIKNASINGGASSVGKDSYYTGGVSGYIDGSKIFNCSFSGSMHEKSNFNSCYVGGISGYSINGKISNCYNEGTILVENMGKDCIPTFSEIGGILGNSTGSEVINCYNTGSVSTKDNFLGCIGGIIGIGVPNRVKLNPINSRIEYCYNVGMINVENIKVQNSEYSYVGGIGLNSGPLLDTSIHEIGTNYCYCLEKWLNLIKTNESTINLAIGSEKSDAQMKGGSNYDVFQYWDPNNWDMSPGKYPTLKSLPLPDRTQVPSVKSITLPEDKTYKMGDELDFKVTYDRNVTVDTACGIPTIPINVGEAIKYADYFANSGGTELVFRYKVDNGNLDNDGIALESSISTNGGMLKDESNGGDANLTLTNISTTSGIKVDAVIPKLTAGTVNRSSDTEATIKFISDKAGQYYYAVVANGVAASTIDTSAAGTSCTTGEITINLTSMTAGSKDVYINVKDTAGNVSSALKINIPEYYASTAPTLDSTSAATLIGAETATIGGNVTADGGQAVADRGIVYSVATNPQLGEVGVTKVAATPATGTGAYTIVLTRLAPSTTYYAKSYASNSVGISYGSEINFTTTATLPAALVTINSINRESPSDEYTNSAEVTYRATFSEAVSGVTASNFNLNSTVTGASIVSVNPVGGTSLAAQWDITVNTGTGDGMITPQLVNSTGISAYISSTLPYGGEAYTINKTTPTEITSFDPIQSVSAGNAGSATYADATAVIAALPKNVTSNGNAVTVPVNAWVDTDSYSPNAAGNYTFTATLGTIPPGYTNSGNLTATVEVVVGALVPPVTAAPSEANITVTNNIEGVQDIITVTGINPGDVVKVYNAISGGSLLGVGTVALGQTSVTINVTQLGVNSGNIYVSVTSQSKTESSRTIKTYAQEIRDSSISTSAAAFDKNVSNQADINVDVNFNGNTLTGISNGGNNLINGTDYVVNGNIITIKKSYLLNQNKGIFLLRFNFRSGNSQIMSVAIVDTTVTNTSGGGTTTEGSSTTSTRTVDVIAGTDSTASPVKVDIIRTVESGTKIDAVKLDESKTTEIISKTLAGNKTEVTIPITDLKDNPADALEIQIPKTSADKLAENGIEVKINASRAKLEISKENLKGISGDVKISIKEVTDKSKIDETKAMGLEIFGDVNGEGKVLGNPIEVEANITGRTKITIPIDSSKLPSSKEELDKFLSSLAVMVHHSDGEDVVDKGTIVYDEKGNAVGISIYVNKFSSFTLIEIPKDYFHGRTEVMKDKVEEDKTWHIKFTKAADAATVTKENVYVVDSKGNKVDVKVSYGSDNILKAAPVNLYTSGETYYLYISKGVRAKDKTPLVNELRFQFTVK